jgi:hypothetical protein
MSEISDLANSIYANEFESNSGVVNYTHISGWLGENLGLLNTLINTSFSGENPGFGLEEKAIYKEIYLYNYYNRQARNLLRGIAGSTNSSDNVLQVSDGDNSITFVNRNEVSKSYKDLARDSKERMDLLVSKYNIFASKPLQVGGYEVVDTSELYGEIVSPTTNPPFNENGGILDAGIDI